MPNRQSKDHAIRVKVDSAQKTLRLKKKDPVYIVDKKDPNKKMELSVFRQEGDVIILAPPNKSALGVWWEIGKSLIFGEVQLLVPANRVFKIKTTVQAPFGRTLSKLAVIIADSEDNEPSTEALPIQVDYEQRKETYLQLIDIQKSIVDYELEIAQKRGWSQSNYYKELNKLKEMCKLFERTFANAAVA